jgi:hypothetical protein
MVMVDEGIKSADWKLKRGEQEGNLAELSRGWRSRKGKRVVVSDEVRL